MILNTYKNTDLINTSSYKTIFLDCFASANNQEHKASGRGGDTSARGWVKLTKKAASRGFLIELINLI